MRVKSLIVLALIVGAVAYVLVFKREWIWEAKRLASGYTAATTPADAMEKFRKAVHERDSKTAALYCTQEYAELLKRGAENCDELSRVIDRIQEYMTNKGLATDKSILLLSSLDPFPKIKTRAEPVKKDDATYFGFFDMEPLGLGGPVNMQPELGNLDPKMFTRALMPSHVVANKAIPIVKDGDAWKLQIEVPPIQTQALEYFVGRAKSYHTALSKFRGEVTNERYGSKGEFERELVRVLQDSK